MCHPAIIDAVGEPQRACERNYISQKSLSSKAKNDAFRNLIVLRSLLTCAYVAFLKVPLLSKMCFVLSLTTITADLNAFKQWHAQTLSGAGVKKIGPLQGQGWRALGAKAQTACIYQRSKQRDWQGWLEECVPASTDQTPSPLKEWKPIWDGGKESLLGETKLQDEQRVVVFL